MALALMGVTTPATQAVPPVNDGVADALVVPALPFSATVSLTDATVDADDASLDVACGRPEATASVWFRYTPAYDSVLGSTVSAGGVGVEVAVDVATGSSGALNPVGCSTDTYEGAPLVAGTAYVVRLSTGEGGVPPATPVTVALLDVACGAAYRYPGDFDGDGCPDLAVGLPEAALKVPGAGWVEVAYGNAFNSFEKRRQGIYPNEEAGIVLKEGGVGFGAALAHGWLDEDRYADLVIGVPLDDAPRDTGAVVVMFGSPQGLGERFLLLAQGTVAGSGVREVGDRFGSSVAVADGVLLVGVPGEDVGTLVDAGAVVKYTFTTGTAPPTATLITQAGAIAGSPESGDLFGSAVAFGPLGMLVIGCPGEDVGRVDSAGAVVTVARNRTSTIVTQDSAGMAGTAEAGDRLGSALAYLPDPFDDGYRLAAGAPGEDISGIRDAGLVNFVVASTRGATPRPQAWAVHQDTPGVAGVGEPGDRFGSVLATWAGFHAIDLLIGVPQEDVASQADAGAVTTVHLEWVGSTSQPVVGRVLTQSTSRVAGVAEAGDRLGAALSTTGFDPEDDDGARDTVYAGAPGEDVAGVADVGLVQALTSPFTTVEPQGRQPGQRFGTVITRDW